ncbi:MAG TPA: TIGR02265 family protein, partial [Archangium sp.]
WVNDIMADQPTFTAGVLARMMELAGGQRVAVVPEGFDGQSANYHVRWSEQADAVTEPQLASRGGASAPRPPA